ETRASTDQEHLPLVVLSEPAWVPNRTDFLLGKGDGTNPGDVVARLVSRLVEFGATVVGIPCNTLHLPPIFDPVVEAARPIRLVSIVDETIRHVSDHFPRGSTVGILGTAATIRFRLYTNALERSGYNTCTLDESLRDEVHDVVIFGESGIKKTHGSTSPRAREVISLAVGDLQKRGAEAVIFGCTELPALLRPNLGISWPEIALIDPTRLLARALIREYNPASLRPE